MGRAMINRRKKAAAIAADPTLALPELVHGLGSITQENDLDEFLSTAQLADTDFTAERQNIKVVADPSLTAQTHNPYLLTPQQEREMRDKHNENRMRLQVPRRPAWTRQTTRVELERSERDSFLEWRRGLADLQDNQSLLLTPFERNLEVWRQLWRTLERSDLIVQIVDARNPLNFRSEDLGKYVEELNDAAQNGDDDDEQEEGTSKPKPRKQNLLLINKSDLLTQKQRAYWATYFEERKIQYAFFSAANSTALQEERARLEALEAESEEESSDEESGEELDSDEEEGARMRLPKSVRKKQAKAAKKSARPASEKPEEGAEQRQVEEEEEEESEEESDEEDDTDDELTRKFRRGFGMSTPGSDEADRTRILSVLELEDLFLSRAPEVSVAAGHSNEKMVVGLVGYPNVGKSSTINALIGEKKVSVSSTPGKTKHFQTIKLSADVLLCDCPGLVFPQFASTKADLVCDGVLPIDQMREHTGPVALITKRFPQEVLEGIYGLKIVTLPISEGGTGEPTATEFLISYSIGRGFFTGGMGNADTARASRVILKDYVNGKLLYCHPPPGVPVEEFNSELRDLDRLRSLGLLKRKQAPTTRVPVNADTYISQVGEQGAATAHSKTRQSSRANALDRTFFAGTLHGRPGVRGVAGEMNGPEFSRVKMFAHQGMVGADGKAVKGKSVRKKAKEAAAAAGEEGGKKHFKPRRQKQRSGRGYDDF
ncbi:ribosome biogenesis large subunit GTPase 1 [Pseudohyphozyma bogoriensis]|nr:ribosome biogenesis large subunit GTPase 1 [Pseudohyphozyma bogoriensis]